jgi:uncharacterized protein with HEPN domain
VSPRSDGQRFEDVVAAIQAIEDHQLLGQALGLSPEVPLLLDAVVRQLAVIGEAGHPLAGSEGHAPAPRPRHRG